MLEEALSDGRQFLVNGEFSAADIAVGYATNFLKMLGVSTPPWPPAQSLHAVGSLRPLLVGQQPCCRGVNALQWTSRRTWSLLARGALNQDFRSLAVCADTAQFSASTHAYRWLRERYCSLCLQLDDEERFPNVRKYHEGLSTRPAFKKTFDS